MGNTHRCGECGHEASGHGPGYCAFGPNKGHIHVYYRIDWNDDSPVAAVVATAASPCTVYARHTGSCSLGTHGCGSYHGR
jgi:hypothetical protein